MSMHRATAQRSFEQELPRTVFQVAEAGTYYAAMLVCNRHQDTVIRANATFMNGNDHLPTGVCGSSRPTSTTNISTTKTTHRQRMCRSQPP